MRKKALYTLDSPQHLQVCFLVNDIALPGVRMYYLKFFGWYIDLLAGHYGIDANREPFNRLMLFTASDLHNRCDNLFKICCEKHK